jgi:hypothetical protein
MLPFKVTPSRTYETVDVGNAEIGVLSIKKYENLTRAEHGFIKEQQLFNYVYELATLAKRISRETGAHFAYVNDRINAYLFGGVILNDMVKVNERPGTVTQVETDKDGKDLVCVDYGDGEPDLVSIEDIEIVSPAWYSDYYADISALTTAYLESLPMQNYVYATAILKFRVEPTWTLENSFDPEQISYELIRDVANFAYQEKNGWLPAEPKQPSTDEDLGKS